MKKIFVTGLLALLLLFSCKSDKDLETLLNDKKELQGEIDALRIEMDSLDAAIAKLDTTKKDDHLELVTVIDLGKTAFNHFIEAQGKTYTENSVMVTTDLGGLVKKVNVEVGQFVNKGQVLMQVDNSLIVDQLNELETNIALAKDVYEKRQRLWEQNIGSQIEYLQAKTQYESLLNKKATVNTQLGKANIKAPLSGYIDAVNTKVGEMAAPGMPVCLIVNNSDMEVRIDVPENYLGKIKVGDLALVELPSIELEKEAKVKTIGQTVNQFNRTFQVIVKIDNSKNDVKSNMLAKVKFRDETISNAIVLPTRILQEDADGYFVFKAQIDSTNEVKVEKAHIKVGESYDGQIVVTEGLNTNDNVIDKGYREVLDGQTVQIDTTGNF